MSWSSSWKGESGFALRDLTARLTSVACAMVPFGPHAVMAPCRSDMDSSGMMRDGSKDVIVPIPLHVLHAPRGLLNEKSRGSMFGRDVLHWGHENSSLIGVVLLFVSWMSRCPFPVLRASSTESATRFLMLGRMEILSMTASMVCGEFGVRWMVLLRSVMVLLILALTNPFRRRLSMMFLGLSGGFLHSGARIVILDSLGRFVMMSVISCAVCAWIGLWQMGQCGDPARAKSSRR